MGPLAVVVLALGILPHATKAAKVGSDADGLPGGCDAIQLMIAGNPSIQISIFRGSD